MPDTVGWFETLTSKTGGMSFEDWRAMGPWACTGTYTLAEIKREIEQLCSATQCDYEKVSKILGNFQANIEAIR